MIRLAYPDLRFEEIRSRLKKAIDSGWLTKGPETDRLESAIAGYLNVKHVVCVSSGTAALHLSLLSLGIGPGDEVIVPDFTFPATANVVELCGAKTVLADIEADNFNINPEEIKKKITHRTKAIIPVHQFGNPAQMDQILKLAKRYNIYVVEDAACALGAKYKKEMCGTMGDIGCFSFHPRKIITTGEGGAIVTDNAYIARRLRLLREHGMQQKGARRNFVSCGFNYRISEIASILGLVQLKRMESIIKKRNKLASEFRRAISHIRAVSVLPNHIDKRNRYAYQSFVIKINRAVDIYLLLSYLRNKGIESAPSNTVLHIQPYYRKKYGFRKKEFKNSLDASRRSLALPFHSRLHSNEIAKIASTLNDYFYR